jgi:two-component system, chemotaxis family, chemotaxis protein CheY
MAKILVVDDSATVRNEVGGFFSENGIEVATANDGKDGLAKLKADPEVKLVFADVNMPVMDGLTMIEKIRSDLKSDVTVIMLTTENDANMKSRGKAAGVKGWIVKPFSGKSVLAHVKKLVGM